MEKSLNEILNEVVKKRETIRLKKLLKKYTKRNFINKRIKF